MKRNLSERAEAKLRVAAGTLQAAVGRAMGDGKLEAKGAARQEVGRARTDAAVADEALQNTVAHVQGVVEETKGAAKAKAGKILKDKNMQLNGKVEEMKGRVRQSLN